MKKRTVIAAALLCLAMLLCACTNDETPDPEPSDTVLAMGDGYEVTENHSSGITKYHYTITAHDGTEIESAICAKQPHVAVLNDDLLGVRFYADNKSFCRYYDLENCKASKSFFNAFWDNGELVAYHDYQDGQRLMVSDIFDENGYYYELDLDIHLLTITVTSCRQDEDTGILTVEYTYDDDTRQGTAELPTREEPVADDETAA